MPAGYHALTGFCRYPGTDLLGFDLGCYAPEQPGACPLGANATSATLQAAAEACQANPGCHAFTSDGWWVHGWMGGWVDGWMGGRGGWMDG